MFRETPFTLLSVPEVLVQGEPEWLVEDMIEVGGLAVVYGPPGAGKSFMALGWAGCIATGRDWHGRKTKAGPVIYVVAEGSRSVGKRLRAFMREHGLTAIDDLFLITEGVQVGRPTEPKLLLNAIESRNIRPRLVIFDTLARCAVGLDENAASDMGKLIAGCGQVQQAIGTAVVLVHHTGKNQDNEERGSSALRGAADTMIKVRPLPSGEIMVESQKQKDDEPFAPLRLRLKSVVLDIDSGSGRTTTSCVLVEGKGASDEIDLHPGLVVALNTLAALPDGTGHSSDWFAALPEVNGKSVPERTFHNWRRKLLDKKLVRTVPDREHLYELTTAGAAAARPVPSAECGTAHDAAATAIPSGDGSAGRENDGDSATDE